MSVKIGTEKLPLAWATPARWADAVLKDIPALLNDHAHLEKKAATNALELLCRWPTPVAPGPWLQVMTSVARDETNHLHRVLRILRRRGGQLSRVHENQYAGALRHLVRNGQGNREILDRLLVSALIELRSCERFALLMKRTKDAELRRLYESLWQSEAGHYRVFLGLGYELFPSDTVDERWTELLRQEAEIIQCQPPGPGMHSGVPAK